MWTCCVLDVLSSDYKFSGNFSFWAFCPGVDYAIGVFPTSGVVEEDPFLLGWVGEVGFFGEEIIMPHGGRMQYARAEE